VDGARFYEQPWRDQVEPLRYVFIGRAGDYAGLVGPVFSNLRVYRPAPRAPPQREAGARASRPAFHFPPRGQSLALQSRKAPAEVSLDPAVVRALTGPGGERWALWRDGHLVHVHGDFNANREMNSLRKTLHALMVGAALRQGRVPSLGEPIRRYQTALAGNDARATWWHLLTQSTGFDYPGCTDPTDHAPGTVWTYSDLNIVQLNDALAKAFGRHGLRERYEDVARAAFFDAIGMSGYGVSIRDDGIRFQLDLEDMGRVGLLALARGTWNGVELVPAWFVEQLEIKQTAGMKTNHAKCSEGEPWVEWGPEAPYGFLTWSNSDGTALPGASRAWAYASGKGENRIFWNRELGLVVAGMGISKDAAAIAEAHVRDRPPGIAARPR
jgi:CubicO group peptidase (beta-lactamase class C family)